MSIFDLLFRGSTPQATNPVYDPANPPSIVRTAEPTIIDRVGAPPAAGQAAATSSLPDGIKSMFAPLMETMIRDAMTRSDPISRFGDVGRASLDTSGSFAKNLGALDTQRQQATGGVANMFLQVMNMDRQIEESKAQERRFLANYDLDKKRLDLTGRVEDRRAATDERRAGFEEGRANRLDRAAEDKAKKDAADSFRKDVHDGVTQYHGQNSLKLNGEGNQDLQNRLRNDKEYKDAWDRQDAKGALDRYTFHHAEVAANPKNLNPLGQAEVQKRFQFFRDNGYSHQDAMDMATEKKKPAYGEERMRMERTLRTKEFPPAEADIQKQLLEFDKSWEKNVGPLPKGRDTNAEEPLPMLNGKPDRAKMVPGKIYVAPNGRKGRWTGTGIEPIE